MTDPAILIQRLKVVTGKPAATVFAGTSTDRQFILEITLGGVVVYLAGKYLDGFVEGLGIPALGKRHGRKLAKAISASDSMIREVIDEEEREGERQEELLNEARALLEVARDLAEHAQNPAARQTAESSVQTLLEGKGVLAVEATRIAADVGAELFGPRDG